MHERKPRQRHMEAQKPVGTTATASNITEETYKQLYGALNEYRFGQINFLELLEQWKAILGLPPSPPR